jgi:hypothetical protein
VHQVGLLSTSLRKMHGLQNIELLRHVRADHNGYLQVVSKLQKSKYIEVEASP